MGSNRTAHAKRKERDATNSSVLEEDPSSISANGSELSTSKASAELVRTVQKTWVEVSEWSRDVEEVNSNQRVHLIWCR